MANLNFNANEVNPSQSFDPLPPGDYKAIVIESEMKPTKAVDGSYLELRLQVVEGAHEGRLLFDRLNLENKNEEAVKIARATLSSICRAVGKMTPKDSTELHNLPLIVKVAVENRKDTGEPANRVKGYKAVNGGVSHAPATAPNVAATKKAPWAK